MFRPMSNFLMYLFWLDKKYVKQEQDTLVWEDPWHILGWLSYKDSFFSERFTWDVKV